MFSTVLKIPCAAVVVPTENTVKFHIVVFGYILSSYLISENVCFGTATSNIQNLSSESFD